MARSAEERRGRLVVGRVIAARPVSGLQLIEHGVHRLVGIGGLALTLHGVEIVHISLIGFLVVAQQTHGKSYSTTFGTRKKWLSLAGALAIPSSAIPPSLTTSGRFFICIGVTDVIGSIPSTLTS